MSNSDIFENQVDDMLNRIGPDALTYYESKGSRCSELYALISQYANREQLINTAVALPVVRGVISQAAHSEYEKSMDDSRYLENFEHCMFICRTIIDLHVHLSHDEEDILLAAALCHILPEHIRFRNLEEEMTERFCLDREVYRIVKLLHQEENLSPSEIREYYDQIQKDKLAVLIMLTDRANQMERLPELHNWEVHQYIYETKTYYFPMCIYAKEHYHELLSSVSTMMDKIRTLTDVSEVLLVRYEAREAELIQDILQLKEDNATIKGIIEKLKREI